MKSDWLKTKVKMAPWKPYREPTTSWISEDDLTILSIQFEETLAQWWGKLNSFEWPSELPRPEPSHFVHGGRRCRIMGWIESKIGLRKCLREWNRKTMTEEEFDTFWRMLNGDETARKEWQKVSSENKHSNEEE